MFAPLAIIKYSFLELSLSEQAALIKYHKLSNLRATEISHALETGKVKLRVK